MSEKPCTRCRIVLTPDGDCNCPLEWRPRMEPASTTLVLDDFNPRRLVSGNRRIHHYVRAEICASWRKLAHDTAVAAYGYADVGETWHQQARIVVTVRFPDRRRRDVSNLYPYVAKPIVDGLIDARILPDDDDRHLVGPDMRRDPERGPHRIVVEIEDLPAAVVA